MNMNGLSQLEPKQGTVGLVHLYVGNGKGKTTAAVGLAARCVGRGRKVLFCQFLKGRPTGEIEPLERLGVEVRRAKCWHKFFSRMNEAERAELRASHGDCLAGAGEAAASAAYDLVVLDEAVDAVNCGALEPEALLRLLRERSPSVEVVLTGRNPLPALVEAADYHTEFLCRKHPYEKGVASRPGVEY